MPNLRCHHPDRLAGACKWWLLRFLSISLLVTSVHARSFQVNYHHEPDPADLMAFDLSILQPDAKVDLAPGHASGRKFLAYLSVVEVNQHASYLEKLKAAGIALRAPNPAWNTQCADVLNPAWEKFMIDEVARPAIDHGFDGFFLDTVDSLALLNKADPSNTKEQIASVVKFIKALKAAFPQKEIIINRGFDLLPELKGSVDGVLVESVFQTFKADGSYGPVSATDHQALLKKLGEIKSSGLPTYVVDYVARSPGRIGPERGGADSQDRSGGIHHHERTQRNPAGTDHARRSSHSGDLRICVSGERGGGEICC